MAEISDYSHKYVLLFGFLSGLWLAVGIDPEAIVIDSVLDVVKILYSEFKFGFMFYLIPILGTITSILGAYIEGGSIGSIAVIFAFIGGFSILIHPTIGIIFVLVGVLLGDSV